MDLKHDITLKLFQRLGQSVSSVRYGVTDNIIHSSMDGSGFEWAKREEVSCMCTHIHTHTRTHMTTNYINTLYLNTVSS